MALIYTTSDGKAFSSADGTLLAILVALSSEKQWLNGIWDKAGTTLIGRYDKNMYLPGVEDVFAVRLKSNIRFGVLIQGDANSEAVKNTVSQSGVFWRTNGAPTSIKNTQISVKTAMTASAGASVLKCLEAVCNTSLRAKTALTIGLCASSTSRVAICASASCCQVRLRRLGDLTDTTFADVSTWTLHEFYYMEVQ